MGASTQPCFTPFITLNDSETSPPTLTFAITPVCRASFIVVNFSVHPYFLSSCHSPVLPTISNALLKSTNATYSGWSCSLHFPCSYRRQYIISTVLWLPLKPHSVSGTTSVLCGHSVEKDRGENFACYGKKRESSIVPTYCSITFLIYIYKTGMFVCFWYITHLPCIGG